ncbi:hypothetical protein OG548_14245 [Streptomyces sp. NBC_01356]|uniref:hypothetical protein n=1 Tax=Streptomyces sp. NBC_01356 TaxID=2903836 RepID=UPI002E2FE4C9|nr:hypothetical protein [Streptomyces sp. NBC_01356]
MRVQVVVVRVPVIPHAGRAYIDGEDVENEGPLIVWVQESLVTEDEANALEAEMNGVVRRVIGKLREPA